MKKLYVEHANTPIKREQGLMGRKSMGKNSGMLFEFPYSKRLSFWMQNTYLPLDIAFIDEEGMIVEIKEMIPMSTRAVTSSNKCRYALEVNKGWFDKNNVPVGSSVAGIGIKANSRDVKVAQFAPQAPAEEIPVEPGSDMPSDPQGAPQQEPSMPDIVLDKSHREMLQDAELKGEDLIIMYVKKDGYTLPPKSISPPFVFEEDAEGNSDAVVKAWDNQDGSWKSFLIDNIIDLQPQNPPEEPPQEIQENVITEQETAI